MHEQDFNAVPVGPLRDGLRISWLSIGWTVVSSTLAVVLGLHSHSVVLLAFGLTGTLDAVGSGLLVSHFRHSLRHEAFSHGKERVALHVITVGLLTVGVVTALESADRLATSARASADPVGVALAAASIVALGLLARGKGRIAGEIPSAALLADSRLSLTGAALAAVTVVGTGLTALVSWTWVDPVAAMLIALTVMVIAIRSWVSERGGASVRAARRPRSR
ncbi:MAG TPA: cation transporter [Acidimicrobiales bacterium]|nr:cation transporter [Acidimicrobiales bacterium]